MSGGKGRGGVWVVVLLLLLALLTLQFIETKGDVSPGTAALLLLAPFRGNFCLDGLQIWKAAAIAAESELVLEATGSRLPVIVLDSSGDEFSTWVTLENALQSNTLQNYRIVAVIGPRMSKQVDATQLTLRKRNMVQISMAAPSTHLNDIAKYPQLLRTLPGVQLRARATVQFVKSIGWKQFSIVALNKQDISTCSMVEALVRETDKEHIQVTKIEQVPRFSEECIQDPSRTPKAVYEALLRVRQAGSRVIVWAFEKPIQESLCILEAAIDMGMYGKGWTWVGYEWANKRTWLIHRDAEKIKNGMKGMIGLVAGRHGREMEKFQHLFNFANFETKNMLYLNHNDVLEELPYHQLRAKCDIAHHELYEDSSTFYAMYSYDSVLAAAHGVEKFNSLQAEKKKEARHDDDNNVLSVGEENAGIYNAIRQASFEGLTGEVSYSSTGDRLGATFDIMNLVPLTGEFVRVGELAQRGKDCVGLGKCRFRVFRKGFPSIFWHNRSTEVPTDRSLAAVNSQAILLLIVELALVAALIISSYTQRLQINYLPESLVVIAVGTALGIIIQASKNEQFKRSLEFDEQFFALILLPIVIFESSYNMKNIHFMRNIVKIMLYSFVGTLISTLIVGYGLHTLGSFGLAGLKLARAEAYAFGAIISAVDPVATLSLFSTLKVNKNLHSLVYGESVINDACSMILYKLFIDFMDTSFSIDETYGAALKFVEVALGSAGLAAGISLLAALTLKFACLHSELLESMIILLFSYMSYQLAEAIDCSGILASLVSGLILRHYAYHNLSDAAKTFSGKLYHATATMAEAVIFFFVGVNLFLFSDTTNMAFVAWTLALCGLGRACNIFPLSAFVNVMSSLRWKGFGRAQAIEAVPLRFQVVMWHAGLRGAIAYALAISFPSHNRDAVVSCVSYVIVITIACLGGTTPILLRALAIPMGEEAEPVDGGEVEMENTLVVRTWTRIEQFVGDFVLTKRERGRRGSRRNEEGQALISDAAEQEMDVE